MTSVNVLNLFFQDDKSKEMLNSQCLAISIIVGVVSIFYKTFEGNHKLTGETLFEKALHWYNVSTEDEEVISKFHHLGMSLAFLQAARVVASDASLEQRTRVEISRFLRKIESSLVKTRQIMENTIRKTK